MIALAQHVEVIIDQILFVAQHAVGGTRNTDTATIAAMTKIVCIMRSTADQIDAERKSREAAMQRRIDGEDVAQSLRR